MRGITSALAPDAFPWFADKAFRGVRLLRQLAYNASGKEGWSGLRACDPREARCTSAACARFAADGATIMNDAEALKKLQETELGILLMLDGFCKEHGIEWFMDSGTALGAMRHEGFIPWDDDIDIGMMRDQYERFVELAQEGLPEGYSLQTFENNETFAGLFAKVYKNDTAFHTKETIEAGCDQGIFVDIFPYDVLAQDPAQRARQLKTARKWQSASYLYHAKTITVPHKGFAGAIERFGCRMAHYLVRAFTNRAAIARRFDASRSFEGSASDEYIILSWPSMKPCRKRDMVPPSAASFCSHELPIPANPEAYLENMYGDWRRIPAPEDRRTHLPEFLDFGDGSVWHAGGAA